MTAATLERRPASPVVRAAVAPAAARVTYRQLRWVLPGAAFLAYLVVAFWMRYELDYAIGDAVSRSSSARAVFFSRAPSMTAIGLVWMPLTALAELPFTLLLEPFGLAEMAGPLMTACCGALAVRLLLGTSERMELQPGFAGLLVALYAFNPVIAFHAANGMSEAVFFVSLIWMARAYLDWCRSQRTGALIAVATSLAMAMAVRYESLLLVPVMAALVGMKRPTWTRRALTAAVTGLPAGYVFFLWLGANQQIMGSALFCRRALSGTASPPLDASWLPADRSLASAVLYALRLSTLVAPGMLLLLPNLVLARGRNRLPAFGLVGAAATFPLFIVYLLPRNETWGNLRYFSPLIPVLVLSAAWLASRDDALGQALATSRFAQSLLLGVVSVGMVTGTVAMATPEIAAVEAEWKVFKPALGTDVGPDVDSVLGVWRQTATEVDVVIEAAKPDARILTNMGSAFPVFLFSDHPGQFILDHDPDHEPAVASAFRGVDLVYVAPGSGSQTLTAALGVDPAAFWVATDLPVGTLYQRRAPEA